MVANTIPIYAAGANLAGAQSVSAANTTRDLTGGTSYLVYTAGANGGIVRKVKAYPKGTNVQTVMRVWWNNGSTTATAANNLLIQEYTCPASTASETTALQPVIIPLDLALKAGETIYVTIGTAVSAGFQVSADGMDF